MRRYFFHTEDGVRIEDDEGTPLPSDAAARLEAVRIMGELLRERPQAFWDHRTFRVTVADDAGRLLVTLDLSAR